MFDMPSSAAAVLKPRGAPQTRQHHAVGAAGRSYALGPVGTLRVLAQSVVGGLGSCGGWWMMVGGWWGLVDDGSGAVDHGWAGCGSWLSCRGSWLGLVCIMVEMCWIMVGLVVDYG